MPVSRRQDRARPGRGRADNLPASAGGRSRAASTSCTTYRPGPPSRSRSAAARGRWNSGGAAAMAATAQHGPGRSKLRARTALVPPLPATGLSAPAGCAARRPLAQSLAPLVLPTVGVTSPVRLCARRRKGRPGSTAALPVPSPGHRGFPHGGGSSAAAAGGGPGPAGPRHSPALRRAGL